MTRGIIALLISLTAILAACGGEEGATRGEQYVWITPRDVTIQTGRSWQFSADTSDSDDSVYWYAGSGSITSDGTYTAPSFPGWDWIEAESRRDSKHIDRVRVKVIE
jgi:hypothetical protein